MIKHLFTSGLRNLYKYRFFSLLNIAGLSIGMAATIMILSWTSFHLSFDRDYKNHQDIYRVVQHMKFEEEATWAITQGLLGAALADEIPGIDNFCRIRDGKMPLKLADNNEFRESLLFVDCDLITPMDIFLSEQLKSQ